MASSDEIVGCFLILVLIPVIYAIVFGIGWSVGWAIQAWIIGEVVMIGDHISLPVLIGIVACVGQFFRGSG